MNMRTLPAALLAGLCLLLSAGTGLAAAPADKVVVLVWEEFIAPSTLAALKKKGLVVEQITFTSEEERLDLLKKQAGQIDLVVGDATTLAAFRRDRLIERIDFDRLGNARYLSTLLDSSTRYNLPYLWGHTGIAWRTDLVSKPLKDYKDLFALARRNPGKVGLISGSHEALMAARFAFGTAPYVLLSPKEVADAEQALKPHLQNLVFVDSELDEKAPLVTGEVLAAQAYNGDIAYLRDTYKVPLAFVIPQPGCMVWTESFMLVRNAPHPDAAYRFLNEINVPALAAANAEEVRYATSNSEALEMVSAEFKGDAVIRPSLKGLSNCYFYREHDRATQTAMDKVKLD
ncbi:MAG: ABC transporter substrate-binding protein [Pseudomonadota bacterium]